MAQRLIPDVVNDQAIVALTQSDSVLDAARLMAERTINAVLVMDGETLEGIFTARDLARRVVGADLGLDTALGEVMSPEPDTIEPGATPRDALRRMFEHGYRHLPIVADGKVVGIVSRRDLFREEDKLTAE